MDGPRLDILFKEVVMLFKHVELEARSGSHDAIFNRKGFMVSCTILSRDLREQAAAGSGGAPDLPEFTGLRGVGRVLDGPISKFKGSCVSTKPAFTALSSQLLHDEAVLAGSGAMHLPNNCHKQAVRPCTLTGPRAHG